MADCPIEDPALAQLQEAMSAVLAARRPLTDLLHPALEPELRDWLERVDPRAWEVAQLLLAKWGSRDDEPGPPPSSEG